MGAGPRVRSLGIIPAYAGSTPTPIWNRNRFWDHPRIRGEHAACVAWVVSCPGSSPHTRGARDPEDPRHRDGGIIPAYAGSTGASRAHGAPPMDHPRIRGEHSQRVWRWSPRRGSSPHTRGAPRNAGHDRRAGRIIPAYAGSTHPPLRQRPDAGDHPRIRGEHPHALAGRRVLGGSSPHTRGARHPPTSPKAPVGIIPAYAGSTLRHSGLLVCGAGSSPHTRGARVRQPWQRQRSRIIPAYAGSTCCCQSSPR